MGEGRSPARRGLIRRGLGGLAALALALGWWWHSRAEADPAGGPPRLYLAVSEIDEIVVLDPRRHEVVDRFSTDQDPHELVLTRDGASLFVSCKDANTVLQLDRGSGRLLARYRTPRWPCHLGVSEDGTLLKVAHIRDSLNTLIPLVPVPRPSATPQVAAPPIEVDSTAAQRIQRAAPKYANLRTTEVAGQAQPPQRDYFLGVNVEIPEVLVTDSRTRKVRSSIPVGGEPSMILLSEDGREAFVTVRREDALAVIDVERLVVTRKIPVCKGPCRMMRLPGGRLLYVFSRDGEEVSVVDTRSGQVIRSIPVGLGALGACLWPIPGEAPSL